MFLVLIGLLVTIVWLLGGAWYISESGGLEMLAMLLPNEVGDFLTGLFAPLAFLWLIIGYLHFSLRLRRIENGLWDVSAVRIPRADEMAGKPVEKQSSWLDPPPEEDLPPDKGPPEGSPPEGAPPGGAPPRGSSAEGPPPGKAPPAETAKSAKGGRSKRGGSAKTSSRFRTAAWPQADRSAWSAPPPAGEPRPGRRFAASPTRYPSSTSPSTSRGGWPPWEASGASSATAADRRSGAPPQPPAGEPAEGPPGQPHPGEAPAAQAQGRPPVGGMASEVFARRMHGRFSDAAPQTGSGAAGFATAPASPSAAGAAPPSAAPPPAEAPPDPVGTDPAEPRTVPPVLGETATAATPPPASTRPVADERPFVPPWPGNQVPPAAGAPAVPPPETPAVPVAAAPTAPIPTAPIQTAPEPLAREAVAPEGAVPEPAVPERAATVPAPPQVREPAPEATVPEATAPAATGLPDPAPSRAAVEPPPTPTAPMPETPTPEAATLEVPPPAAESKPVGFRHLVRITSMELNTICMDLASLLCAESDRAVALKGYDKGEKDVFFGLLSNTLAERDPKEVLQTLLETGADSRLGSYMRKFEALAEESKRVDKSGALAKSLEALPIGRLYQRIRAVRATAGAA